MPYIRSAALLLPILAFPLAAEPVNGPPVRAELIPEVDGIVPGGTFTVALHLTMAGGYHTYWRHPGTVGLPTSIRWRLPEGFRAGPLQWPVPRVCRMASHDVWGYAGTVMLIADITAPEELPGEGNLVLGAEATWMGCSLRCHPGFQVLELPLPITDKARKDPRHADGFEAVRRQQPQAMAEWELRCRQQGERFRLRITGPPAAEEAHPHFFGFDRLISSSRSQRSRRLAHGWEIEMFREEFGPVTTNRLAGMLVRPGGWRARTPERPLRVDVAIEQVPGQADPIDQPVVPSPKR